MRSTAQPDLRNRSTRVRIGVLHRVPIGITAALLAFSTVASAQTGGAQHPADILLSEGQEIDTSTVGSDNPADRLLSESPTIDPNAPTPGAELPPPAARPGAPKTARPPAEVTPLPTPQFRRRRGRRPPPPRDTAEARPETRGDARGDRRLYADAPPKPRLSGLGLVIPGWVMVGGGSLASLYSLALMGVACGDNATGADEACAAGRLFAVGGVLVAGGGLTMALFGHSKLRRSRQARREWKQQYGQIAPEPMVPVIAPVAYKDGGGGAAFSMSW